MSHASLQRIALLCAVQLSTIALIAGALSASASLIDPTPAAAQAVSADSSKSAPKSAPKVKAKVKKPKVAKVDPKVQAQLNAAQKLLVSGDRAEVEQGIQSLGLLGVEAAVPSLVARIELGLPRDLLETAIVTLMALGQQSAGPALFELAHYRRAEIRLRAIEAIAAVRPSGGEAALVAALSDSESSVRSAASTGLGEIGTASSIETLFRALDHGNLEAAVAIGKLVPAREVRRLFTYLGKVPFRSLSPAFAEALKRKDVSESDKLAIVARLEEVGTGEVKAFFGDLMTNTEGALPPAVSKAALRAMQEIAEQ